MFEKVLCLNLKTLTRFKNKLHTAHLKLQYVTFIFFKYVL